MTFGDIRTVGELIDALEHFDKDMAVEMCYGTFSHREIDVVEKGRTEDYYQTPVVLITAKGH
jgi:hypothetical protein